MLNIRSFKKIFTLLSTKHQYLFFKIVILILIGTLLESFGVGIIPSILSYLTSNGNGNHNHFFMSILNFFSIQISSEKWLAIYLGISYLGFIILKNIFLLYKTYKESKFINEIRIQITESLAFSYLSKDYDFLIEKNSSELIRNLTEEINQVIAGLIKPLIILINESILIVSITIVLVLNEPIISIILIFLILIASFIFYKAYTKKIKKLGKSRQYHYGKYMMWLDQTFKGFKEIKSFGVELIFLKKIIQELREFSNSLEYIFFISEIPRIYIESILLISIFLILILTPEFGSSQSPLAGIALYGAGALKIIPSFSRISSSITRLKFSEYALNAVEYELKNSNLNTNTVTSSKPVIHSRSDNQIAVLDIKPKILTPTNFIEFADVYYRYAEQEINAIDGVSFNISQSNSVGFVGLSGSGKSTLIDLLTGLLKPCSGKITVNNRNIADPQNLSWWRKSFGYIPQSIYILDDTIRNNIKFGLDDGEDEEVWDALKNAKLDDFVWNLPNKLDTIVGENAVRLSGGQRQRLGISRALYKKPDVIVMDEATSALDNQTEKAIIDLLYKVNHYKEKTLIIVAHRLTTVEGCDYIYFMENGRIVDIGSYNHLLSTNERFRNIALVSG